MSSTQVIAKPARIGANRLPGGGWEFLVWAPNARAMHLKLPRKGSKITMDALANGYHRAVVEAADDSVEYSLQLDGGRDLPDPASRFQPHGVHGPSQTVDMNAFQWTDHRWQGIALENSIIYELHVGTYTPEGTFDAIIPQLAELADLGVNTIELMPVAQFPGSRNWGYDGVYLFAPQNSYGGPQSLQRLVDAAHRRGLSVALDVVYNHLGPEGNYLSTFGPYFTGQYHTPWGQALNFDQAGSDEVRRFFIDNALYWLEDYHIDALRLDAIHSMFDFSARHFLAELKSAVAELSQRLGRKIHLIAESDLNDARILHHPERGGYDLDAQWSDDFHHSVHALLTHERHGYYSDFTGIAPLVATLQNGWYYSGQYSNFRGCRHGNSPRGIAPTKFVVCNQNHDQVGNRAAGERLSTLVNFEALKLAAGITLLSPFVPLLFMGEEYGENAPFQYFVSHGDPQLVEAVRRGRREEFSAFGWQEAVPDPQDEQTFARSHIDHSLKEKEPHRTLFHFYRRLIRIREELGLGVPTLRTVRAVGDDALMLLRESDSSQILMLCNFASVANTLTLLDLAGTWAKVIYSAEMGWNGTESDASAEIAFSSVREIKLSPFSFLLLEKIQRSTEAV